MGSELKQVIKALIEKTQVDEVNWRHSSADGEYSLFLNQSTITIGSIHSFSETSYIIRIYNEDGNIIEEVDSSKEMDSVINSMIEKLYLLVDETFSRAKRTIHSVLDELKQSGVVGGDNDPREIPF